MLLALRIRNFRSLRDEQEILLMRGPGSLQAAAGSREGWRREVSPLAAVYGANASGKSTLFAALAYLVTAVDLSHRRWAPESGTERPPFMLDTTSAASATLLEIEFVHEGVRYQYGFEVDDRRFTAEWLYAWPGVKRQTWFERSLSDDGSDSWYFGKNLGGPNRTISGITRANSLFLSASATAGHARLTPVHHYITSHLQFVSEENQRGRELFTKRSLEGSPERAERVQDLLQLADLGVCGLEVVREEVDEKVQSRIARLLAARRHSDEPLDLDPAVGGLRKPEDLRVQLFHRTASGSSVPLPFDAESAGTRALFGLAGPVLHALEHGMVLMVDEIDTSLHPVLVSQLIALFRDERSNPRQAQLIFSSHDTAFLGGLVSDAPLLDRDQIWFVQKGDDGASVVYPLTDFKPRKSENLERGYLQGRYGAVPLRELHGLGGPTTRRARV